MKYTIFLLHIFANIKFPASFIKTQKFHCIKSISFCVIYPWWNLISTKTGHSIMLLAWYAHNSSRVLHLWIKCLRSSIAHSSWMFFNTILILGYWDLPLPDGQWN
jgi:hypothetical protein